MASSVRSQIWLNFTQLPNNEWVYHANVMMTKQETGVGESEDLFLVQAQHSPQNGSIHFEISEEYRPMLTEEEKKYLYLRRHPIASSSCIPHTRGNIPAALHHGEKSKAAKVWDKLICFETGSTAWVAWSTSLAYSIYPILDTTYEKNKSELTSKQVVIFHKVKLSTLRTRGRLHQLFIS